MYSIFSLTLEQVAQMINDGDDSLGNKICVTHTGEVSLKPLNQWEDMDERQYRFHFDSFDADNGYVGKAAAQDTAHIESVYKGILYTWKKGIRGYYDLWRGNTNHSSVAEIESMEWPGG